MIFVTVGSQKFQFNRLLKKIDELIETGVIDEEVFGQIGVSTYRPLHFQYVDFMTQEEFINKVLESNLVITHAGTGSIIKCVKNEKKVIGVPRLAKYGEHVDDHQIQLIHEFGELGFIEPCTDLNDIEKAIKTVKEKEFKKYISNTDSIINSIKNFIEKEC